MTTERVRRGRRAPVARRVIGGASLATVLGLVAVWSATEPPPDPAATIPPAAVTNLRVVITDPAIDPDVAVAAALDAAARGITTVTVPVAEPSAAVPDTRRIDVPHATTRAS